MIPIESQKRLIEIENRLSELYELARRVQAEAEAITPISIPLSDGYSYEDARDIVEGPARDYYVNRAQQLRRYKLAEARDDERSRLENERNRIITYWGEQAARIAREEADRLERERLWSIQEAARIERENAAKAERQRQLDEYAARVEAEQRIAIAEATERLRIQAIEKAANAEKLAEWERGNAERAAIRERLDQVGPYVRTPTTSEQDQLYWKMDDPRWRTISVPWYSDSALWESLLRRLGFGDSVALDPNTTALGQYAINDLRARGYDFRRKHPDRKTFNIYWGFVRPDGTITDIEIPGTDPTRIMLSYFMIGAGGWLGPLATSLSVPAPVLSAGINIAAGADPLRAIAGAALPTVVRTILPSGSVLPDTGFGEILPADEWLTTGAALPTIDAVGVMDYMIPTQALAAELLTAPQLLPLDVLPLTEPVPLPPAFEPVQFLPEPLPLTEPVELPPAFEPVQFLPEPLPVIEPVPLPPTFEPEPVQFEPAPVVELPAVETMAPIPTIDAAPPTIEPVEVFLQPPEVPAVYEDEYLYNVPKTNLFPEFEGPLLVNDPFAALDDFSAFDPYPGAEIPPVFIDQSFDVQMPEYGWGEPGEVYPPAYDVVTVDEASQLSTDILVGGNGGGMVETGGNFLPNPSPADPGLSVGQILRDANAIMLDALKLVDSYRRLTNPQTPNRVAQARVGSSTVRATPGGMIETIDASGRVTRRKPPVGQPQMTTDGSMIVNNGDGTYTSISPSGAMATMRYPADGTAAAPGGYSTALLIGGAVLALAVLS